MGETISLSFKVHGDHFTNLVRDRILDGNVVSAVRILRESLPDLSYDQVYDILSGKKRLAGVNSFTIEDEDPEVTAKVVAEQEEIFGHMLELSSGEFVKAYAGVTVVGIDDFRYANRVNFEGYRADRLGFCLKRALYYADDPTVDIARAVKRTPYLNDRACYVLFKKCPAPPPWMETSRLPDAHMTIDLVPGRLQERGSSAEPNEPEIFEPLEDAALDKARETMEKAHADMVRQADIKSDREKAEESREREMLETLKRYRAEIARRVSEGISGTITVELSGGQVLHIPEVPFAHWVCGSSYCREVKDHLPPWEPVADSGWKMHNDDRYHTDWLIGTTCNHPLWEDVFDLYLSSPSVKEVINDGIFDAMEEAVKKYGTFVYHSLAGNGSAYGLIEEAEPDKPANPDRIAIAPNASPSYLKAMMTSQMLIVGAGGTLCHLAIVANEKGKNIVLMPGVMEKLKPGMKVSVSGGEVKIQRKGLFD